MKGNEGHRSRPVSTRSVASFSMEYLCKFRSSRPVPILLTVQKATILIQEAYWKGMIKFHLSTWQP